MAFTASSTDSPVISLFVTIAKQDSPVQIMGFKLPGGSNNGAPRDPLCPWCPKVRLHNTTARQVKKVLLRGVAGDPNRPNETQHAAITYLDNTPGPPTMMQPNGDGEFADGRLWPFSVVLMAAPLVNSTCLHIAMVVSFVEFTDGTIWTMNHEQERSAWKESLRQADANSCSDSPDQLELKRLHEGTASIDAPSLNLNLDLTSFYSASCLVHIVKSEPKLGRCTW
jgi:hypothetical protein